MKKIICSILTLAICATAFIGCSDKKDTNSSNPSNTSVVSDTSETTTKPNVVYKKDVQYGVYRVIIDNSLTEKSLQTQMNDNKGIIPNSLLNNSFIVQAYYYIDENNNPTTGDLIFADNKTDMLYNLNDFTVNDDFTEATFISDTSSNEIKVKIKSNENDELCLILDENNTVAVQVE